MQTITPTNIFDLRDRQIASPKGYLTFRLYEDGWLVRFTPFDGVEGGTARIKGADVWTACRFANDHLEGHPSTCSLCGGQDGEHEAAAHAEEGRW